MVLLTSRSALTGSNYVVRKHHHKPLNKQFFFFLTERHWPKLSIKFWLFEKTLVYSFVTSSLRLSGYDPFEYYLTLLLLPQTLLLCLPTFFNVLNLGCWQTVSQTRGINALPWSQHSQRSSAQYPTAPFRSGIVATTKRFQIPLIHWMDETFVTADRCDQYTSLAFHSIVLDPL